jgi:GT2 family glycosyltransferase
MAKTVAVVIVNWNSWPLLARCLDALAAQTFQDFSVTIIDNASQGEPPENLLAAHPTACLVRNPTNTGFAAANNLAVNHHTGNSPWVALLNPDAFAQPDWLAQLMQAAVAHPDCAVFASRQLNAADPSLLDGDGDNYHVSGRAWRGGFGQPLAQAQTTQPGSLPAVFSPCGAAALYRRSAYVEVGGLDEDFFCYFEDVDLGFRLQLAGYSCLLVPHAVVHHVGSAATGGQHGDFAVYHGHRNLVWTYFKNMPGALFWLFLPLHLALNLVTLLRYRHRLGVVWRAKKDALLGLPRMLAKRQRIQARRLASTAAVWRVLSKRLPPL